MAKKPTLPPPSAPPKPASLKPPPTKSGQTAQPATLTGKPTIGTQGLGKPGVANSGYVSLSDTIRTNQPDAATQAIEAAAIAAHDDHSKALKYLYAPHAFDDKDEDEGITTVDVYPQTATTFKSFYAQTQTTPSICQQLNLSAGGMGAFVLGLDEESPFIDQIKGLGFIIGVADGLCSIAKGDNFNTVWGVTGIGLEMLGLVVPWAGIVGFAMDAAEVVGFKDTLQAFGEGVSNPATQDALWDVFWETITSGQVNSDLQETLSSAFENRPFCECEFEVAGFCITPQRDCIDP